MHSLLSVMLSGYLPFDRAPAGQARTHLPHPVHRSFSIGPPEGSSAQVSTETNLILGPRVSVSSMLFIPKVPSPARYAAWRWEKKAEGALRRPASPWYPSRGM